MRKSKNNTDSPEKLNKLVEGVTVNGDLVLSSSFRLDGVVTGNIKCDSKFVLGETGKLKGNLSCMEAEIEGVVEGDIKIENLLTLRKTANIQGTIESVRLVIEDGAQVGGNVSSGSLPPKKNVHKATNKSDHKNTDHKNKNTGSENIVY